MKDLFEHFPIEFIYGVAAVMGGVARYLNGYANGAPFKLGIFLASTFVSGFSGWMFALLGIALYMPFPFIFMMAGVGGFFGDQSLKFLMEYVQKKIQP